MPGEKKTPEKDEMVFVLTKFMIQLSKLEGVEKNQVEPNLRIIVRVLFHSIIVIIRPSGRDI